MHRTAQLLVLGGTLAFASAACATTQVAPAPTTAASSDPTMPPIAARWLVKSHPHVDLWIHSFAMIANDTAVVPHYLRGYRDSMTVLKNSTNLLTALDANRETLWKGLSARPEYLHAQFLAFEYADWPGMRSTIERFLQYNGDPQRARNQTEAQQMASWASVFRTSADREWLRLFLTGVTDEAERFYLDRRAQAWRDRNAVVTAIDSLWHKRYMPQYERFLSNTGQRNGDLLLSMPLGGEGRATQGRDGRTLVAVTFPARVDAAPDAVVVFAHEVVGGIVSSVIDDHTTPVEKRSGVSERMVAIGQVRAGAMLVQRVTPDLLDWYVRFYLEQGRGENSSDLAALERAYPLPDAVVDGLERQIDVVLGGI